MLSADFIGVDPDDVTAGINAAGGCSQGDAIGAVAAWRIDGFKVERLGDAAAPGFCVGTDSVALRIDSEDPCSRCAAASRCNARPHTKSETDESKQKHVPQPCGRMHGIPYRDVFEPEETRHAPL